MVTQEMLKGRWKEISGRLRSRWGEVSGNEWTEAHGDLDQLIGLVQRKTGEARATIEAAIEDAVSTETGHGAVETAREYAETAREYVERAGRSAQAASEAIGSQVQAGYEGAQAVVQQRPMESLLAAFGAGLIGGVLLGLAFRSK